MVQSNQDLISMFVSFRFSMSTDLNDASRWSIMINIEPDNNQLNCEHDNLDKMKLLFPCIAKYNVELEAIKEAKIFTLIMLIYGNKFTVS